VCLLHGKDDELSPFSQSVHLSEALERREHPHEFYSYEGLSHYFSTYADNETAPVARRRLLGCFEIHSPVCAGSYLGNRTIKKVTGKRGP
jgi:hypothetical protein